MTQLLYMFVWQLVLVDVGVVVTLLNYKRHLTRVGGYWASDSEAVVRSLARLYISIGCPVLDADSNWYGTALDGFSCSSAVCATVKDASKLVR
jgi:hypothetical protein